MNIVNVVINGAEGKMGKTLIARASSHPDIAIVGKVGKTGGLAECIEKADVIIDFSFHEATATLVKACAGYRKPMVIGTTGHTDEELREITYYSNRIPMVVASNFSTGVSTLFWLTHHAAKILGPSFDLEVIELHHRKKKDAPSGTAVSLRQVLSDARQLALKPQHGRVGQVGPRSEDEIGIHAVRGGDVVGEHQVHFLADGERLCLTHIASSRETFANGALRAGKWVVGKPPRIYSMKDVLELHWD